MKNCRALSLLLIATLFLQACGHFNRKKMRISFRIANTGSLTQDEITDRICARFIKAFDVGMPDIEKGPYANGVFTITVNGLPGEPGLKERIEKLCHSVKLGFWKVVPSEEAMQMLMKINSAMAAMQDSTHENPPLADSMQRYPLMRFLMPFIYQRSQRFVDLTSCALCRISDTAQVMGLIRKAYALHLYGKDLRFAWGRASKSLRETLMLYVLKGTPGGSPVFSPTGFEDVHKEEDRNSGGRFISMSMNADDARKWKFLTNECAPHMNQPGRAIAICLDDIVFSAPVVQGTIEGGRSEINGSFTEKEANELVDALRAGTLPFDLNAIRIEEMK